MVIKLMFDNVDEIKEFFYNFIPTTENIPLEEPTIKEADSNAILDDFIIENLEPEVIDDTGDEFTINYDTILWYGKYRYHDEGYFKTKKARSGCISLTGIEALKIASLINQGKSNKEILDYMMSSEGGFNWEETPNCSIHKKANLSTIRSFRKAYDKMELNAALSYYCNKSTVNEDPLLYVKFPDKVEGWL